MHTLETIGNHYTKYEGRALSNLDASRAIIKGSMSSISRLVEVTDQHAERNETFVNHMKKHETEVTRLNGQASQRIPLERKAADTLEHSSGAFASLPASLKRVRGFA